MLNKIFAVRLSPELFRQLDIASKAAGLTPSEFTRAALVAQLQQSRPPAPPVPPDFFADVPYNARKGGQVGAQRAAGGVKGVGQ